MQPRQARRSTAAVAGSTLLIGVALVVLAFVLSACGSSADKAVASASSSAGTTASASTTASGAAPGTPSVTTSASATPSAPPAGTAPASGAESTQPPVGVDQTATFTAGLTSTVLSIEPIAGTAALPGEIAGPAVRVTLAVQNGSGTALDLGNVTVDLQDAAAASATPLSGDGATPFTGSLAPGSTATGVFVFALATDDRTGVTLYVTVSASLPVVVFTGNLT